MTEFYMPADILRAVLICASEAQIRRYLNGVYIDPALVAVATDGHRILAATILPCDENGEPVDVPKFDGWIIPRETLKKALAGHKARLILVSPNRIGDVSCTPVDGTFPDWRRVVPAEVSGVAAHFNANYVADFGKIYRLLTGHKNPFPLIHHNGEDPAGVTFGMAERVIGVLMPVRRDSTEWRPGSVV